MKKLLIGCLIIASCNNQPGDADIDKTTDSATTTKPSTDTEGSDRIDPDWLIIPGEAVGKTRLGEDANNLETILGKPGKSDAAMGKAWMTWEGKRDEHNNATELNVYTAYKNNLMQEKTVQQIRTTSNDFSTAPGTSVYSSLDGIRREFPDIKKAGEYNEDGRTIEVYDDKEKGIAFEIASANTQRICTGIIIHLKGEDVTEVYRMLHPGMETKTK